MCQERDYGEAGCLLAYGANIAQLYRQSAGYVGKILQGACASDPPIAIPERIELLVNAATVRKTG